MLSAVLSWLGAHAISPADGERVEVRSLLSPEGIGVMFADAIDDYVNFTPLGLIVVMMLGVMVAEQSGLLAAMLRGSVTRVPAKWLTFVVALAGISTEAAGSVDPDVVVTPIANYFFNAASAIFLAIVITLVTELVLSKRTSGMETEESEGNELGEFVLSVSERRGMLAAGATLLVSAGLVVAALVPEGSWFRGADGSVMESPLIEGIAVVLVLVGVAYGMVVGTVTRPVDVPASWPRGSGTSRRSSCCSLRRRSSWPTSSGPEWPKYSPFAARNGWAISGYPPPYCWSP